MKRLLFITILLLPILANAQYMNVTGTTTWQKNTLNGDWRATNQSFGTWDPSLIFLKKVNNLSDLSDKHAARTNLSVLDSVTNKPLISKINGKLDSAANKATINKVNGKADSARLYNAVLPTYLPLAGGVVTGDIQYNVLPVNSTSLVNKSYIDNALFGLSWKTQVDVATTANITLSGTQTIDGVALAVNKRVLVKDQSDQTQNGIYLVSSGAWTRTSDADSGDELFAATVMVKVGTINKNTQWTNNNTSTPVIGTDPISFAQIAGAGTYTNGTGLNLTGNVFSLNTTYTNGLYPQLSGSYNNPSWINQLAYSKITGVPNFALKDSTFNINKNGFDILDKAAFRNNLGVTSLLTGYVPYTGATGNVNLGTNTLFASGVTGSTASGGNLTLSSTSNATKGKILFGNSAYDEVSNRLGINITSPTASLDVNGDVFIRGVLTANLSNVNFGNAFIQGGGLTGVTTNPLLLFSGASSINFKTSLGGSTNNTLTNSTAYGAVVLSKAPITTFSTGTHPMLSNLVVNPIGTVTSGGASVTNTSSLYIEGAGSGGTNNYAFYSNSGVNYFEGNIRNNSLSGSLPVKTDASKNLVSGQIATADIANGAVSTAKADTTSTGFAPKAYVNNFLTKAQFNSGNNSLTGRLSLSTNDAANSTIKLTNSAINGIALEVIGIGSFGNRVDFNGQANFGSNVAIVPGNNSFTFSNFGGVKRPIIQSFVGTDRSEITFFPTIGTGRYGSTFNGSSDQTFAYVSEVTSATTPKVLTKTANYTVATSDFGTSTKLYLHVDCTAGSVTITLPTVGSFSTSSTTYELVVVKDDSSANSINVSAAVNINGSSTYTVSGTIGASATITGNGTQYFAKL